RPVVGEVRLPDHEQAGDGGLQVLGDPEAAHRVVHRRANAHRHLAGVLPGDLLVHLEQAAVLRLDRLAAHPLDRGTEVQVHPAPAGAHTAALVTDLLGRPRGHVPGHQVAECGIPALQVVVPLIGRDVPRVAGVPALLRHPDATVVAQRLAHQGELRLEVTGDRDTGRVDLGVAGVGEVGTLAVGPPGGRHVAAHRVRGQEVHVAVAAAAEHHSIGQVSLDLAGDHVPHDHPAGPALGHDQL